MGGVHIPIPPGTVEEPIEHAIEIIAETFKDDPFHRYALIDDLQAVGERDISYEMNKAVFDHVIPGMVNDGARCITLENTGISSVWYVCRRCNSLGNKCLFASSCFLFSVLSEEKKKVPVHEEKKTCFQTSVR